MRQFVPRRWNQPNCFGLAVAPEIQRQQNRSDEERENMKQAVIFHGTQPDQARRPESQLINARD
jgi:hypothetical protein